MCSYHRPHVTLQDILEAEFLLYQFLNIRGIFRNISVTYHYHFFVLGILICFMLMHCLHKVCKGLFSAAKLLGYFELSFIIYYKIRFYGSKGSYNGACFGYPAASPQIEEVIDRK